MYTLANLPPPVQAELIALERAWGDRAPDDYDPVECRQSRGILEAYILQTEGHEMIHQLVRETAADVFFALTQ